MLSLKVTEETRLDDMFKLLSSDESFILTPNICSIVPNIWFADIQFESRNCILLPRSILPPCLLFVFFLSFPPSLFPSLPLSLIPVLSLPVLLFPFLIFLFFSFPLSFPFCPFFPLLAVFLFHPRSRDIDVQLDVGKPWVFARLDQTAGSQGAYCIVEGWEKGNVTEGVDWFNIV